MHLVLLPSILGDDGFINKFLSNPIFRYISRISFCMYLFHYMIIERNFFSLYRLPEYELSTYLGQMIVDTVITIFVASLVSLFVEIPFANIDS